VSGGDFPKVLVVNGEQMVCHWRRAKVVVYQSVRDQRFHVSSIERGFDTDTLGRKHGTFINLPDAIRKAYQVTHPERAAVSDPKKHRPAEAHAVPLALRRRRRQPAHH
jgi:hypothetical protein